jgi:hypothetical protein
MAIPFPDNCFDIADGRKWVDGIFQELELGGWQ